MARNRETLWSPAIFSRFFDKLTAMAPPQLIRLNLRASIEYAGIAPAPFDGPFPVDDETREFLFCFELDRGQAARIDPDPEAFPGTRVFSAKRGGPEGSAPAERRLLPAGQYAFMQERRELSREECVALAIELQKDGLWERLRLGTRLYVRRLFEDGSPVTQVFRPFS